MQLVDDQPFLLDGQLGLIHLLSGHFLLEQQFVLSYVGVARAK